MSLFHFYLSATKNLGSFQLLPASLITDLLQLFLGFPLFLFPWGFQSRAAFGISPSSFLNVWPIHLNFLFLISKFKSSCPVTFHRSLLEIIFGHYIALYGTWVFSTTFTRASHLSQSWARSIESFAPASHFWKVHYNIISSVPLSPRWSPCLRFPHQNLLHTSLSPHSCYVPHPSHSSWFYHMNKPLCLCR